MKGSVRDELMILENDSKFRRWMPSSKKPRAPKRYESSKPKRKPSTCEKLLTERIWKYMRRYKGYKYS